LLSSRTLNEKIAFIIGLVGAILGVTVWGLYHWDGSLLWGLIDFNTSYLSTSGTEAGISEMQSERMMYYILLFIPACLAFTSVLFNKKYLMFLAVFLHLPIGDFISGTTGFSSFTTIQIVWVCYLISGVISLIKINPSRNKNERVNTVSKPRGI
jgi:phosphoglycerol transferase MdoB-like AlkP superfamily enzyme